MSDDQAAFIGTVLILFICLLGIFRAASCAEYQACMNSDHQVECVK